MLSTFFGYLFLVCSKLFDTFATQKSRIVFVLFLNGEVAQLVRARDS